MNSLKLTFCCLFFASFLFIGCADGEKDDVRSKARQNIPESSAIATPPPATAGATNPGVSHYICSNNCVGSGGDSQGNCPVCGNAYEHNAAFHNNTAAPTATTTAPTPSNAPPGAPAVPEPAQNANGVWHYTCSAGCAGGAGRAGSCGSCGGELAHNTAYHN